MTVYQAPDATNKQKKDARFKWKVMSDDRDAPIALGPRAPQLDKEALSIIFVIKKSSSF